MKIVVLDGYTLNPGDLTWDSLRSFGEVTVYDRTPAAETINRIGHAEAIYTNKTVITKEVIEACPNLKFIGVLATGYNTIDIETAARHGITVSNVPLYSTETVAQFTIALMLELSFRIGGHSASVHAGEWTNSIDFSYHIWPIFELPAKTVGLVGYGRIGQAVAKIAHTFGMRVLVYSRSRKNSAVEVTYVSLDELLSESDFVSLHVPQTTETNGLMNADQFRKMKKGSYFINTARGGLVVEEDLADALNQDHLAGAAVDVVSSEPIQGDNPLLDAKNCIITPHIAWAAKEARSRLMSVSVENLAAFISGQAINVVNR